VQDPNSGIDHDKITSWSERSRCPAEQGAPDGRPRLDNAKLCLYEYCEFDALTGRKNHALKKKPSNALKGMSMNRLRDDTCYCGKALQQSFKPLVHPGLNQIRALSDILQDG
jgi:hypothetical protein